MNATWYLLLLLASGEHVWIFWLKGTCMAYINTCLGEPQPRTRSVCVPSWPTFLRLGEISIKTTGGAAAEMSRTHHSMSHIRQLAASCPALSPGER